MPIYTYRCKKCGNVFEKFKSMNANGTENCELCSSEALRVFSPAGIIFKGSGFYTTDYKSGSSKANLNSEAAKSDSKEIKKEDGKPLPQPERSSGHESSTSSGSGSGSSSSSGSGSSSDSASDSGSGSSPNRDKKP